MSQVTDYTGKIPSANASKPNFVAMVSTVAQSFVDAINAMDQIEASFNLAVAVGVQLDIIGKWVGVSRNVQTPIVNVFFAWDTTGLGFDQAKWLGPYTPSATLNLLGDDTFRQLIQAKIGLNSWDGTITSLTSILNTFLSGSNQYAAIVDGQDMTMTIYLVGISTDIVKQTIITGGYLPLKPAGVTLTVTQVASSSSIVPPAI